MATTLTQDAADQGQGQAESGAPEEQTGGGETDAIGSDKGTQPEGQEGSAEDLGPENLPPELEESRKALLRDYHEKMQKMSADRKQFDTELKTHKNNSEVLQRLFDEPWFKKAYDAEKNARSGVALPQDMSEEQLQDLGSNPRKLVEFMQKYLETVVENKLAPTLKKTSSEVRQLQAEKEKDRLSDEHDDFKNAHDSGALDKYLDQGHGYESAYAMWRLKQGQRSLKGEAEREAEKILAARKAGSVERTGAPKVNGTQIFKAKSLNDALEKGFEARQKGLTNFRIERE